MSYCLNPNCLSPQNPDDAKCCQGCKTRLLLNDRYRPLDPIGRGGFGRTFKARDEYKPSKPYCVIKQFHGKGFDDAVKAKELFHREAELQEKLGKHPQIPELLALCPQDNYLYLVQEFIDGRNLTEELKQEGTFSEEKVWQLLEDLLPVLQFVHTKQVVHRDIKPENIIRHRADNTLFLVDFGIAKLATEAILAKTGTVIGTEGYTSPEQHDGKPRFASDLYSLGATCYHLLTYADPSRLLYGWVDWQKELRDKLENRDISDELIDLLTKLLQPDISQRYQSAKEVLRSLSDEQFQATSESSVIFSASTLSFHHQNWRCIQTITGHLNYILCLVISPDGEFFASSSDDKTIKLWKLFTGELLHTLSGHSDSVNSVAFSNDGQLLASGSGDGTIKLWDLERGELLDVFAQVLDSVQSIAFSPDGETLACGTSKDWRNDQGDFTIKLWRVSDRKLLRTFSGYSGGVYSVAFSPDGQLLAGGSGDSTIQIWNPHTGELIHSLTGHSEVIESITISSDSQILISSSYDGTIKRWNLKTGKLLGVFAGGSYDEIYSIAISLDNQGLISAGYDGINLWYLSPKSLHRFNIDADVYRIAISPDNQTFVSGNDNGVIKIWRRD